MMKRSLFIILGLSICCIVQAQEFSAMKWHEGLLVTADQDTMRGKVKYDLESNTVQISTPSTIKALSSHKVFYFEIYDELYENYRQFYSIPYELRENYQVPILFELLYEGGLSLLAREKIVQENVSAGNPFWTSTRYPQNTLKYNFYFLDKKGNIRHFSGSKNELLDIMSKERNDVKTFIKENKLRTDEVQDLIRIASFYNSI